jgi:hypothetical protein
MLFFIKFLLWVLALSIFLFSILMLSLKFIKRFKERQPSKFKIWWLSFFVALLSLLLYKNQVRDHLHDDMLLIDHHLLLLLNSEARRVIKVCANDSYLIASIKTNSPHPSYILLKREEKGYKYFSSLKEMEVFRKAHQMDSIPFDDAMRYYQAYSMRELYSWHP